MRFNIALSSLVGYTSAAIVWDGRFNGWATSAELNNWSWSNQVGPYQYYIHGPGPVTNYVNLSPSYKNPADSGSNQGAKITLDSTAYWNGQNMRRTELIPQVSPPSSITTGKLWYHFSISRSDTNPPSLYREHQIAFFESHFTELKSGANSGQPGPDNTLRWAVQGQTKWSVAWEAGVWHNFAYEIDFSANTVALWHSTGASPLSLTVSAVSVSTSSNGADWHVGVLELPVSGQPDTNEDYFFSGVYIENGSITTSVAGPGGVVDPPPSSTTTRTTTTRSTTTLSQTTSSRTTSRISSTTTTTTRISTTVSPTTLSRSTTTRSTTTPILTTPSPTTTSRTPTTTTTATQGGATQTPWGQCGGLYWTGPTLCPPGWVCKYNNDWYSQCLQG